MPGIARNKPRVRRQFDELGSSPALGCHFSGTLHIPFRPRSARRWRGRSWVNGAAVGRRGQNTGERIRHPAKGNGAVRNSDHGGPHRSRRRSRGRSGSRVFLLRGGGLTLLARSAKLGVYSHDFPPRRAQLLPLRRRGGTGTGLCPRGQRTRHQRQQPRQRGWREQTLCFSFLRRLC